MEVGRKDDTFILKMRRGVQVLPPNPIPIAGSIWDILELDKVVLLHPTSKVNKYLEQRPRRGTPIYCLSICLFFDHSLGSNRGCI